MKLIDFCKIYTTTHGQVLIRKAYNPGDEKPNDIIISIVTDELDLDLKISTREETLRDNVYDVYNPEDAEQYVECWVSAFEDGISDEEVEKRIGRVHKLLSIENFEHRFQEL